MGLAVCRHLAGSSLFRIHRPDMRRIYSEGRRGVSGNKRVADGVLRKTMSRSFEETVLPHVDAAFNYARWLTRSDADAEDLVQDAYVRALRFFSSLRGEDARAWLLTIVRNTWYGRFPRRAGEAVMTVADKDPDRRADASLDPEALLIQQQTVEHVRDALEALPTDFREVLVLRELEGLSYKEIAEVVGSTEGAARVHYHNAIRTVKEYLKDE